MQHRNTYQPPNTPSFTIETTEAGPRPQSPSSPAPSPSRSTHFLPPPPRSNSMNQVPGGDYFVNEKLPTATSNYPPQRSPTSARFLHAVQDNNAGLDSDSSSVHLPLLNHNGRGDHDHDSPSPPPPASSRRGRTTSSSNGLAWITLIGTTRTRLHPLVLIPVFVLGVVFSMSLSGSGSDRDIMGRSAMATLKVKKPLSL